MHLPRFHTPATTALDTERDCNCICFTCSTKRCLSHCWFLLACCSFLLVSSLPRLSTLLDASVTVLLYLTHVRQAQDATKHLSVPRFVRHEFSHWQYEHEALSVVLLALVRSAVLFTTFAYRYHRHARALWTSVGVVCVSLVWLFFKLVFNASDAVFPLLLVSLLMVLAQVIVYVLVRRRKILLPARRKRAARRVRRQRSHTKRLLPHEDDDGDEHAGVVGDSADPASGLLGKLVRSGSGHDYQTLREDSDSSIPVHRRRKTSVSEEAPPSAVDDDLEAGRRREGDENDSDTAVPPEELADPDSEFIGIDGLKIHYKRHVPAQHGDHDASSYAVVLLHGFGGSVFSWKMAWDRLCALPYQIIAFDRPGFGLSSRPVNGNWNDNPYTDAYQTALVLRLMERLSVERAVLVGHSSGGALALQAAAEAPSRVLGVLGIAPTIFTEGFPRLIHSLFRTRLGKEMVRQLVRTEIGQVTLRRAWYNPKRIPEAVKSHYRRTFRVHAWHEALMEMTNVPPQPSVAERLGDIQCPVWLLHGRQDRLVPVSESRKAHGELLTYAQQDSQMARLVVIDRCGHVPHEERVSEFVPFLAEFLEAHFRDGRMGIDDLNLVSAAVDDLDEDDDDDDEDDDGDDVRDLSSNPSVVGSFADRSDVIVMQNMASSQPDND